MFKYAKAGLGVMIGSILGYVSLKFITYEILLWGMKNKEFMEYEKNHNPETYEYLRNKFPQYCEKG